MRSMKFVIPACAMVLCSVAQAASLKVNLYTTEPGNQAGKSVGYVTLQDTQYGLLITPHLKNITPGWHGFHVHQNPSCADNGEAAGPHIDPQQTKEHLGPYNQGHLGDMPALSIQANGTDAQPVVAPRLTVANLKGHSLIIHENGDNYSDHPLPLGGGGPRAYCGIIK
ncbi:MAG TPA: superoxide dismutase family protein [Coxiellaceae bacterium]|nr:superoxide dismutase family protein [Coxiellaceae bacterium]